jgi:hypothetical protein
MVAAVLRYHAAYPGRCFGHTVCRNRVRPVCKEQCAGLRSGYRPHCAVATVQCGLMRLQSGGRGFEPPAHRVASPLSFEPLLSLSGATAYSCSRLVQGHHAPGAQPLRCLPRCPASPLLARRIVVSSSQSAFVREEFGVRVGNVGDPQTPLAPIARIRAATRSCLFPGLPSAFLGS